jgi:hypothetical protein
LRELMDRIIIGFQSHGRASHFPNNKSMTDYI